MCFYLSGWLRKKTKGTLQLNFARAGPNGTKEAPQDWVIAKGFDFNHNHDSHSPYVSLFSPHDNVFTVCKNAAAPVRK